VDKTACQPVFVTADSVFTTGGGYAFSTLLIWIPAGAVMTKGYKSLANQ
jgi:hypothetical protein